MELTPSFVLLLQDFLPVFTAPTFQTFVQVVTGWLLSHRHRYITEVIFAGGNLDNGHWCRFHRFFSHAAWSPDGLAVCLCLLIVHPFWAPTKVFALPIVTRLYRNRQGLTKGKKSKTKACRTKAKPDPNHRTRPQLAIELMALVAAWFPHDDLVVSGDSAYGGRSVLSHLPGNVHLISQVHPKGALYAPAPPRLPKAKGPPRKKGARLPGLAEWAADTNQPWTELAFDQFGLHAVLQVKTQQALYYKAGGQRLLTIVLTRDRDGQRPDHRFYCTKLDWSPRQILAAYACRWAIECTFENSKQYLGLEDPANRLPQAVRRTAPMALVLYTLVVVWFHVSGHLFLSFPRRPWYRHKQEPSFADLLTTLRRVSYEEQTAQLQTDGYRLQTWITQLTELLSRTG